MSTTEQQERTHKHVNAGQEYGRTSSLRMTFRRLTVERQRLHGQYADCKTDLHIADTHPALYSKDELEALLAQAGKILAALRMAEAAEEAFAKAHPEVRVGNGLGAEEPAPEQEPPRSKTRKRGVTAINVTEMKELLRHLSPSTQEMWLKVGAALASTNHSAAFTLWDDWSRAESAYDYEHQYQTWQHFQEARGTTATLGTLYAMAEAAGWSREAGWEQGLLVNQHGAPLACPANIAQILRFTPLWKDLLRYDLFGGYIEYGTPQHDEFGRSKGAHRWTDTDDARLADYLRAEHKMAVVSLSHCGQAVDLVAKDAEFDPIVSWLDGLPPWDNEDRLACFFEDFCGVEKSPYAAFCGTSLFLSLVARAYEPGCQSDTVLVLEGAEGAKKTSLCRLLGGPWYKAITTSFESKDLFVALRRTWIGELAELDSFARSGQNRIKGLLTILDDTYRPPFGRNEINQPRRSVFIGTTNEPAYIVDPHGARRFYPMTVGEINIEGVAAVLPQLYAEACFRYKRGDSWWEESAEVAAEAAERRENVREVDPWETKIAQWAEQNPEEIVMDDLLGGMCLDIPPERRTRAFVTRLGVILHRMGFKYGDGKKMIRWHENMFMSANSRDVGT